MNKTCKMAACYSFLCMMWCAGSCNGGYVACSFCAGAVKCACNNGCESACLNGCGKGCSSCCFGIEAGGCSGTKEKK